MTQIALPLSFDRQYSFDNYFSDNSEFIVSHLKALIDASGENLIGLWGATDSGKTHLLNACAFYARAQSPGFQLYDAAQLVDCDPGQFDELLDGAILAIDNLDAVCGNRPWETVFYRLINRSREQNFRMIFSLSQKPQALKCDLADFQSRLNWALMLALPVADEIQIDRILVQRAELLGFELSSEVRNYLLTRFSRGLADQIQILRQLDLASLSSKKKITIPMVKQVLKEAG